MDIQSFFKSSASGGKKLTPVAPETPATPTTTECGGALASSTNHDPSYVFSGASQSGEHDSVCDLGTDEPQQVILDKYPVKLFGLKKRSFSCSWYKNRDWLEYSFKADAAFCFPCRKFSSSDTTFTMKGFTDWKHATETSKGLNKHGSSKEHLRCESMWKESKRRRQTGTEISSWHVIDIIYRLLLT